MSSETATALSHVETTRRFCQCDQTPVKGIQQVRITSRFENRYRSGRYSGKFLIEVKVHAAPGIDLCVQPVSATPFVVYRPAFGSPRSFADVD